MNFKTHCIFAILALGILTESFGQMTILSGPKNGSYNQFANDIVSVLAEKDDLKVLNKTSRGSAFNFKEITNPESPFKIAFMQADYLNQMEAEDKLNNTNKTASLKILMPLASEEIHIIAKKSSNLHKLQDLDMKKVGIGNQDLASNSTAKMIKTRSKIHWYPYEEAFEEILKSIASDNIDAGIIVGSAPLQLLNIDPQVMTDGIRLLELNDFNGWAQFYENDTVYAKDYKWLEQNTPTFSVRTVLVVNESKLSDYEKEVVTTIKGSIIQNIDYLKENGHPKWGTVIIPDDGYAFKPQTEPKKTVAKPEIDSTADLVIYRVQIYSRSYNKPQEPIAVNGTDYNPYVYSYLGAYRYTIGEFTKLSDATELQKQCRQLGYKQAFVAAFKNGVRDTDPDLFK